MRSWLREESEQIRQTSALIGDLAGLGFAPITTSPTRDSEVRRDHTLAIIERLASWSPSALDFPIKIFSSGPIFERGRWAESLDVEVLEDEALPSAALIFDLLSELISERSQLTRSDNLVFVVGHLGLLRDLLGQCGLSAAAAAAVETAFAHGYWARGEQMISGADAALLPLFRPSPVEFAEAALADSARRYPQLRWEAWQSELPRQLQPVPSLSWDLSLTGSWPYYSGPVFALYARGQGDALLKGGRFSVHYQDRDWHGVGFTISLPQWFERR